MNAANGLRLLVLGALWGASFLFIKVGVADFGAAPLAAIRVSIAALVLLALLALRGGLAGLRQHARPLFVVGLINTAVPFFLFSWAEETLNAGLTSVIHATTPTWGALVAYVWMQERLAASRVAGMALGFAGVLTLVWYQIDAPGGGTLLRSSLAAAGALGATLCYGIGANSSKRLLAGVPPLVVATGSMLGASLALLPFALLHWPAGPVTAPAWGSVIALGVACTALAYLLFFRLVADAGPTAALSVSFVVPLFGVLWGTVFLDEPLTPTLAGGLVLVLAGTALATGLLRKSRRLPTLPADRPEQA